MHGPTEWLLERVSPATNLPAKEHVKQCLRFDFYCARVKSLIVVSKSRMMKGTSKEQKDASLLRTVPEEGTVLVPQKNQGYQLPLHLWQDLVDEAARRRRLGLPLASQNAIAIAAISAWLEHNKGAS